MRPIIDNRHSTLRRDLNNLVRDDKGDFSLEKIGTYVGQYLAASYLVSHLDKPVPTWDIMTVWFVVLTAPSLFKKLMNMKYGGKDDAAATTTTATAEVTTTTKGKK
jgi:hypothetical protein